MRSLRKYIFIVFCALSLLFLAIFSTTQVSARSSSPSAPVVIVKTASAVVGGKTETILTDVKGFTLYYYSADTKTTPACTGACTTTWHPFVVMGSITPTGAAGVTGTLTVVKGANGPQVQYNGHFLYTYAPDLVPRQIKGQGIGGKWFVATPSLS